MSSHILIIRLSAFGDVAMIDEGQIANIIVPIDEFEDPLSPETGNSSSLDEKVLKC